MTDFDEPPFPPYDPYEDQLDPLNPAVTRGGNTPPQDIPAEQAVLGALLLEPHRLDQIRGHLHPNDFWRPAHETIYQTICHLADTGRPVEPLTVFNHLNDIKQLARIGGPTYLHDLEQACGTPANIDYYADLVLKQAKLRQLEQTGTRLVHLAHTADTDDIDTAYDQAFTTLDESFNRWAGSTTQTPATWAPVDLEPVLAGEYLDPPPTMLARADGVFLLYDGTVHTISGESESGKTWLTLLAVLQTIKTGHRSVFIDFEDRADRVIGRLLALGATPTQIRDHFAYVRPDRPLDDTGRQQLAPHLSGARLVIIDGVTEAMTTHGYDLNSNADSALFQALLPRWIADHGPAVVLIDHVVKDSEKQGRHAIGAQHKLAGIDGAAYMVKCLQPFGRGKIGRSRVTVAKDRPGHVREHTDEHQTIAEFTLDASIDGLVLQAELRPNSPGSSLEVFEPTMYMERVSRYIETNPGLSKTAIGANVKGRNTMIHTALELLTVRGYVTKKNGKHYHAAAFREDPADCETPPSHRPDEPDTPLPENPQE